MGAVAILAAGATDALVRWSAGQAIVLWCVWLAAWIVITLASSAAGLRPGDVWIYRTLDLAFVALWAYSTVAAFRGKKARLPGIASLTERMFTGTIR
ncbi:MAG: hypothetical protein ACYC8W_05110 [Candidatus Tyrphobacter sp.]